MIHPNDVSNDHRRRQISAILGEIECLEQELAGRIPHWDHDLKRESLETLQRIERRLNRMLLEQEWRPR
jgi:hypothetical protein